MSCKAPAHIDRCFGDVCSWCRVSPPAAPELPEGWKWHRHPHTGKPYAVHMHDVELTIDGFRALLATQGLSIVDAKDRAVLEAIERAPEDWLHWWRQTGGGAGPGSWMQSVGEAELARREKP